MSLIRKMGITTLVVLTLAMGVFAGVTIGLVMEKPHQKKAESIDVPPMKESPLLEPSEQDELAISVRVDRSEKALRQFVYEEGNSVAPLEVDETLLIPKEDKQPDRALLNAEDSKEPQEKVAVAPVMPVISDEISPPEKDDPGDTISQPPETVRNWRRLVEIPHDLYEDNRPKLAIVIDDVGIDQKRSGKAIQLKAPMTLSFIPYGRNLAKHVDSARKNGHEIMLHLPMEPQNPTVDPGPNAMLTKLTAEELKKRLDWGLAQFQGYVGINNHMGSKFTAWEPGMQVVLSEVDRRGLFFMDSVTSPDTVGYRIALERGMDVAIRDVFIDHDQTDSFIERQLKRMEQIATEKGWAIAIGHPHDSTLRVLNKWSETVEKRGFRLVPVSSVILFSQMKNKQRKPS